MRPATSCPAWCAGPPLCTAARPGGEHRSTIRTVEPRSADEDVYRLDVSMSVSVVPGYRPKTLLNIESVAAGEDEPEVLSLGQRQAVLLARAIDAVLVSAWYPQDARPALLGAFAGDARKTENFAAEEMPPRGTVGRNFDADEYEGGQP